LAWFNERGVREEGVDDTAEHDGLGGEGHEVALPVCFEFRTEGFDFFGGEAEFGADVWFFSDQQNFFDCG
jgi:hypothetical protein